jgi:CPA1 family monovalent cation:H+ antiporter
LDGLVFVMLGTQLPRILQSHSFETDGGMIIVYILLISLMLMITRFLWWLATVRQKTYENPENPIGVIRAGLIFCVAGARGAVSMASVFSIPLLLPGGQAFPEREVIILIVSGVIVISLLMTNFILPLLIKETDDAPLHRMEQTARNEILQTVARRLKRAASPDNFYATEIVVRNYYSRINQHPNKRKRIHLRDILQWEKDIVLHMVEMEQMSRSTAERYLTAVNQLISNNQKIKLFQILKWTFNQIIKRSAPIVTEERDAAEEHQTVLEVALSGFDLERSLIQDMHEAERLSEKTAKEMLANISMLEAQLQA